MDGEAWGEAPGLLMNDAVLVLTDSSRDPLTPAVPPPACTLIPPPFTVPDCIQAELRMETPGEPWPWIGAGAMSRDKRNTIQ